MSPLVWQAKRCNIRFLSDIGDFCSYTCDFMSVVCDPMACMGYCATNICDLVSQIYAILCHEYMRFGVEYVRCGVTDICDLHTYAILRHEYMRCVQHIYAILNCMHRAISNICTVNIEDILESNIATVGVPYAGGIGL